MNASDIVGYTFNGAEYCLEHPPENPPECTCAQGELDEYGLCQENCHGYGPAPDAGQLQLLYRVGPATAAKTIAGRADGPYESAEDWRERVPGVGERTFACNEAWIVVEGETTRTAKAGCGVVVAPLDLCPTRDSCSAEYGPEGWVIRPVTP